MDNLITQVINNNPEAPVVVLFGGNPLRRDEVLRLIGQTGNITAYGALSEEEGLLKIKSLPKLDLVLIGGRYSQEQRIRIKKIVKEIYPAIHFSEPGWDYPYDNTEITIDIQRKLGV